MRLKTGCRIWRQGGLLAVLAVISIGCVSEKEENPKSQSERSDQRLERILTKLEKDKPSYSMVKEIIVDGVPVPAIQTSGSEEGLDTGFQDWKLDDGMSRLKKAGYSTKQILAAGVTDTETFSAQAEATEWTALIKKDWADALQSMKSRAEIIIEREASKLKGEQAELLRTEMSESASVTQSHIEESVRTLEAAGSCRFTLKKGASLPDIIVLENQLQYKDGGHAQSEIIRLIYRREEAGKAGS